MNDLRFLQGLPAFQNVPKPALKKLLARLDRRTFKPGGTAKK